MKPDHGHGITHNIIKIQNTVHKPLFIMPSWQCHAPYYSDEAHTHQLNLLISAHQFSSFFHPVEKIAVALFKVSARSAFKISKVFWQLF